jgi:hypothetical protein
MPRLSKKVTAIAAAGVLTVATAGGAYAYWTSTGAGSGSATTASSNGSLTLTSGPLSGAVTPGSSNTFTIFATNPGTSNLQVTPIRTRVSSTVPGCQLLISDFAVADVPSTVNVPAATSEPLAVGTGTLVYSNTTGDQDACKSAHLDFAFSTAP